MVGSVVCLFWVFIVCVRFIVGFVCLVVLVIVAWAIAVGLRCISVVPDGLVVCLCSWVFVV